MQSSKTKAILLFMLTLTFGVLAFGGYLVLTVVSLVPSGFYQFYFAVRDGMWYARSPEIASGEVIRTLAKLRIGPDLIFAGGAALMLVFVARAVVLTLPEAVAEPVEMVREQDREFRVLGRA